MPKFFTLAFLCICCLSYINFLRAQNPKIKCYFNHPVNNSLSTGTNAVYLNGTFPDTIVAYINRAKYSLDFAIYDFTSNGKDSVAKIATAVNSAYKRGVVVRWINNGSSTNSGMSLLNAAIPRISSPTTSGYGIMHNKFVVVDVNSANPNDAFVITGSYNFSAQQSFTDYNNLLIIQDKPVATAFYDQFNQMWGGTGKTPNSVASAFGTNKKTSSQHYFNVNGTMVDVHFSPKDTCGNYLKAVANSANTDLFFGIYTFTDNSIATILLNKFNNKLTVKGIMDQFSATYSPFTTLSGPLGNNMVEYTGTGLYHNKILIADALNPSSDPQVATGSFNWTAAAENSNDENLMVVHDATIANQYYQSLCKNLSDLGGAACLSPLPLSWLGIEARLLANNNILINWKTSEEQAILHYEVEQSNDAVHFSSIGTVDEIKKGDINHYQFRSPTKDNGVLYFRIKAIENDGVIHYSPVSNVTKHGENNVLVYPNPAKNDLQVLLPENATNLICFDIYGKQLIAQKLNGKRNMNMNVAKLPSGNYSIAVQTTVGVVTCHLIKL